MRYRAAVCTALTGPESIRIEECERKPLQPGEVRIAIKAAGLNFPDLLMTYGKYQFRPDPPFVPGMEFSGEVIEVGAGVTNWKPGDGVMGGGKGDCIAEEAVVPAAALATKPDALSWEEAACWRAGGVTAWHALHDKAALKAGETLLVLGAAGGVGMAAVSLGKYMGAIVIGTGSSPEKRAAILAAGADHALDPADPDLAAKVKELTDGKGCDVVFDPVGGDLSITATRAIGWGGRFLIVGFASGSTPSFPANHALIKGYSLIGLRAGEASRRDPELAARTSIELKKLAEAGVMRPHISHRLPLDQTRDALLVLERREAIGRVVLTLGD
ncbi:MAG TPA: NADPH:quinone oxidoreductase family protein [Sphingorhabdus sp.]|jgi:NADPH2:quinone reductase|uniref:NADPH:quinone oxidoreductase family protein n=1 Tax=Sphingorhabdus sp. TaxID=1902408 RepID=UPI002CC1E464|nr:NADPH:quinone oxidoreductase family protein [Sphingorhabdus sp.]HMT40925.1 NADPH:quinone oxidoreductase family protein [Sphingorhabdus sp.]HMU22544.1 NADPH:quinone oxidoreductase family protein [Sphingorhabdus sp.]